MSPHTIGTLDTLFPYVGFATAAVLVIFVVNFVRYLLSGKKIDGKRVYGKKYPIKSVALFVIFILGWMEITSVIQSAGKEQVTAYLATLNLNRAIVLVNGQSVRNPAQIVDALRPGPTIRAHHSHHLGRFPVTIQSEQGDLTVELARDSQELREYWVYYPSYMATNRNPVYRIHTAVFDKY